VKTILMIMLTTLIVNISLADVIKIDRNEITPFAGLLVTEKTFNNMTKDIKKGELSIMEIEHYQNIEKLNSLVEENRLKQIGILRSQNEKLVDRLEHHQSYSNLQKTVWFVIGVVTTGIAVKLGREI